MRKIISVFSTIILALTLISCSGNSTALSTGKVENNNYINDWLDIKIEQLDGWTIIPDEQLTEMYSNQSNVVIGLGDSKKKEFEQGSFSGLYPLGLVHSATNASILLGIEKSDAESSKAIDNYISNLKGQLEQLESQGLVYKIQDPKSTNIGEFSCTQIEAMAEYGGNNITQNYYLQPKDGYIFALITTAPSDSGADAINELLNNIKKAQ